MKTTTRSQACCWHDTYLEGKVNNFAFLNPFTWLQRIPAHPASQSCQMVDNMQLQLCLERPFSNVGGCPVQLDRPRAWLKDGSTATAILTSWTTRTLAFWMYVQGRSFIAQLWYIDLWNWYLDVCGDHLWPTTQTSGNVLQGSWPICKLLIPYLLSWVSSLSSDPHLYPEPYMQLFDTKHDFKANSVFHSHLVCCIHLWRCGNHHWRHWTRTWQHPLLYRGDYTYVYSAYVTANMDNQLVYVDIS